MLNKSMIYPFIVLAMFCAIVTSACSSNSGQKDVAGNGAVTLANPASVKCIKDGYALEQVKTNGVVTGSVCRNKRNGKKCEIWSYFRGECSLD